VEKSYTINNSYTKRPAPKNSSNVAKRKKKKPQNKKLCAPELEKKLKEQCRKSGMKQEEQLKMKLIKNISPGDIIQNVKKNII
jgi:hypothetical protein